MPTFCCGRAILLPTACTSKVVNKREKLWSVRAGAGYRALGTREGNIMYWT